MTLKLTTIEKQLDKLIGADGSWYEQARLLAEVQDKELYKEKHYPSFNQWLKSYANKREKSVNTLMQLKGAGRRLDGYVNRHNENSDDKITPADVAKKVSFRSLQEVSRIAGDDEQKSDSFVGLAYTGKATSVKLRKIADDLKIKRKKHTRDDNHVQNEDQVTAPMMVEAFQNDWKWLEIFRKLGLPEDAKDHKPRFYRVFAELPVPTEQTKKAQRMDETIFETITDHAQTERHVNVHGIENKVTLHDLQNDHKWDNYIPYCDYFWICVPPSLTDDAARKIDAEEYQGTAAAKTGILQVDKNQIISIVRPAQRILPVDISKRSVLLIEALTHSQAQINAFIKGSSHESVNQLKE